MAGYMLCNLSIGCWAFGRHHLFIHRPVEMNLSIGTTSWRGLGETTHIGLGTDRHQHSASKERDGASEEHRPFLRLQMSHARCTRRFLRACAAAFSAPAQPSWPSKRSSSPEEIAGLSVGMMLHAHGSNDLRGRVGGEGRVAGLVVADE